MAKKKNKKKSESEQRAEQRAQKAQQHLESKAKVQRAVRETEAERVPKVRIDDDDDLDDIDEVDAEHIALTEAVKAARESAAVLREAANALSQSAAQSVAVSRWGQFPGQNMGMPNAGMGMGMMPPMLPPYYGDGMRPPAPMEMPGAPAGYYDDPRGTAHDADMRESVGYSPKEPVEAAPAPVAEEPRGKRWGSPIKSLKSRVAAATGGQSQKAAQSEQSMFTGLPKFGEAPDPLPSPQEILASLPSFDALGQPTSQTPQPDPLFQQGTTAAGMPVFGGDGTSFQMDATLSQVPPVQEQVIEIPAQEVVYGEVQMPDAYVQAYDATTMYDPAQMVDPLQGFDVMQNYDPYAYNAAYDPYADPAMFSGVPPKGGMATASLILGIFSILLAFIPPLGIILAVLAIVFAKSYLKKGGMAPRAGTGRVCGIVGIVLSVVLAIALGVFIAYFVGGLYGETNAGAIMGYLQTTPLAQFI